MNTFPLAPFLCGTGFMTTLIADHVAETLSQRAGWGGGGGHGLCAPAGPARDGDGPLLQQVIVADGTAAPGAPRLRGRKPCVCPAGRGVLALPWTSVWRCRTASPCFTVQTPPAPSPRLSHGGSVRRRSVAGL